MNFKFCLSLIVLSFLNHCNSYSKCVLLVIFLAGPCNSWFLYLRNVSCLISVVQMWCEYSRFLCLLMRYRLFYFEV
jgi:hypothetical protein